MEHISNHITYAEAVKSQTASRLGIPNSPNKRELEAMHRVAQNIFEPVRRDVAQGRALAISSFFRSADVNAAIGGGLTSQHCKGEAIDMDADLFGNGTNQEVFNYIRNNLEFDQLIWEFGTNDNPEWVHCSLKAAGNRRQVLRSYRQNGRTIYKIMK